LIDFLRTNLIRTSQYIFIWFRIWCEQGISLDINNKQRQIEQDVYEHPIHFEILDQLVEKVTFLLHIL